MGEEGKYGKVKKKKEERRKVDVKGRGRNIKRQRETPEMFINFKGQQHNFTGLKAIRFLFKLYD